MYEEEPGDSNVWGWYVKGHMPLEEFLVALGEYLHEMGPKVEPVAHGLRIYHQWWRWCPAQDYGMVVTVAKGPGRGVFPVTVAEQTFEDVDALDPQGPMGVLRKAQQEERERALAAFRARIYGTVRQSWRKTA